MKNHHYKIGLIVVLNLLLLPFQYSSAQEEKKWLNNYHDKVFKVLRNYMSATEIKDLKRACSTI